MPMLTPNEREFAQAVSTFTFLNPFQREDYGEHIKHAAELGRGLSLSGESGIACETQHAHEVMQEVIEHVARLLARIVERRKPGHVSQTDFQLYQDLVLFDLYYRFRDRFQATIEYSKAAPKVKVIDYYDEFQRQWQEYWSQQTINQPSSYTCEHTFACLFQVRRAYHHIYEFIWGESPAIRSLRSKIWQSIFSHDFRRFGLLLYNRMENITTLVTGPSGSGKELVAKAIGMSRYIAFDPAKKCFAESIGGAFHPVNISALAPTIVESELFGHAKGAFSGADEERDGWFKLCLPGHSVFLDEIGELSPTIQVKLLRVLQCREFHRLGETNIEKFRGKLIVASNRDFGEEVEQGRFREDLYYRICSDVIATPSLKEQLSTNPQQLHDFAQRFAKRHLGNEDAAREIARDMYQWVEAELGLDYDWPGNFRELEQCVWNVLVRKSYHPIRRSAAVHDPLLQSISEGSATAADVLAIYCRNVYQKTGSYAAAAKIVELDQRTVKNYVLRAGGE